MSHKLSVIIIEKNASIKSLTIKDYNEGELYKKCGFKIKDGFKKQHAWKIKLNGQNFIINLYGKVEGRANSENKYDFPPPADNVLFFGNCLLVGMVKIDNNQLGYIDLTKELWETMYNKLFGGFDNLANSIQDDENEYDELVDIPDSKKTKEGYLKDNFIVDDEDDEDEYNISESDDNLSICDSFELDSNSCNIHSTKLELDEEMYDDE